MNADMMLAVQTAIGDQTLLVQESAILRRAGIASIAKDIAWSGKVVTHYPLFVSPARLYHNEKCGATSVQRVVTFVKGAF